MLEFALAKLTALGVASKTAVGLATAASVVAVGGATGVVPVLPPQATGAPADDTVLTAADVEDEDAEDEAADEEATDDDAVDEDATDDAAEEGTPAPQASFGQSVSERAQDGGVDGADISAEARQRAEERRAGRELPEQAAAGQANAAEKRSAGQERAATNRSAGQEEAEQDQVGDEVSTSGAQSAERPERSTDRGEAGRTTAGNAPVNETAPAGTPAEERTAGRR